jgi:hypothetical protein
VQREKRFFQLKSFTTISLSFSFTKFFFFNFKQKKGTAGSKVKILCNFFEILNKPDWRLYQYHVDYAPAVDSKRLRIALLKNHDALFPQNKAFDGMTLYSLTKLENEVCVRD